MHVMWITIAAIVGLVLGSFGNVLIYRVPRGMSISSPPSTCPSCAAPIARRHNVPVLSWLWLRGRCARCNSRISARYPAVELATGAAFVAVIALTGPDWSAPALLGLVYFGIVLSAIDLEVRRLPDALTAAFAIVTAATLTIAGFATGEWSDPLRGLWGALILGGLYAAAFVAYPRGMGFGDVKLAPSIGAVLGFLGWAELAVGGFAAFLWGGIFGVMAMLRARRGKGVAIPFGPWMFVGAVTGVLVGAPLARWYIDLVGL